MSEQHPNDPLHGITLKTILEELVERCGWEELGKRIKLRCFTVTPSLASSLKYLRRVQWARTEVEKLYLEDLRRTARHAKRNKRRAERRAQRLENQDEGSKRDPQDPSPS